MINMANCTNVAMRRNGQTFLGHLVIALHFLKRAKSQILTTAPLILANDGLANVYQFSTLHFNDIGGGVGFEPTYATRAVTVCCL